jgi:hypothetical protein
VENGCPNVDAKKGSDLAKGLGATRLLCASPILSAVFDGLESFNELFAIADLL